MKLLWVATKSPWPPRDGGRLLLWRTLEALAAGGLRVTLVAPLAGAPASEGASEAEDLQRLTALCRPRLLPAQRFSVAGLARAGLGVARLARALAGGFGAVPVAVALHQRSEVSAEVGRLLASEPFDAVVAEQVQALPQCAAAHAHSVPVVVRCQNVESLLWERAAARRPLLGPLLRRDARRLARWEGTAIAGCAAAVALTSEDAARLEELCGGAVAVEVVPAPFPAELPASSRALPGDPAVVLFASAGWAPNAEAALWFVREVWRSVRARCPEARLHVFGELRSGAAERAVTVHPAPLDSRAAFVPGSVFAVPLRTGSGVRMKILEAWARGIPVVASPAAAAGLGTEPRRELLEASGPEEFSQAIHWLHERAERGHALAAAGRELLRTRHDPGRVLEQLLAVLGRAIGSSASGR